MQTMRICVYAVERGGLDLAILSTLMRLLEVQVMRLEGDEGTGPLEQDLQLLARSVRVCKTYVKFCAPSTTCRKGVPRCGMRCCTASSKSS